MFDTYQSTISVSRSAVGVLSLETSINSFIRELLYAEIRVVCFTVTAPSVRGP
jgi:hypothetical protein